jgi:hypothetical protein
VTSRRYARPLQDTSGARAIYQLALNPIAGKVLHVDGSQHRFAFARNGNATSEFAEAIVSAGVSVAAPR